MTALQILPVTDMPEIAPGTSLHDMITNCVELQNHDVIVITSKIVSKAEGRVVTCDRDDAAAREELIRSESVRVLRQRGPLFITETRHGFICANAGIDWSNVQAGHAVLLPLDPDRSARDIMYAINGRQNINTAVVVSDTFGRVWRNGAVDVAIGSAGLKVIQDWRGQHDSHGNTLTSTQVCTADEIAAAASLVMGKTSQIPVAIVRGIDPCWFGPGSIRESVVRPAAYDMFR